MNNEYTYIFDIDYKIEVKRRFYIHIIIFSNQNNNFISKWTIFVYKTCNRIRIHILNSLTFECKLLLFCEIYIVISIYNIMINNYISNFYHFHTDLSCKY